MSQCLWKRLLTSVPMPKSNPAIFTPATTYQHIMTGRSTLGLLPYLVLVVEVEVDFADDVTADEDAATVD